MSEITIKVFRFYFSKPSEDDSFFYFGRSWDGSVLSLKQTRYEIFGTRLTIGRLNFIFGYTEWFPL